MELGLVEPVRGKGGGLRLSADPAGIRVGWLIQQTEPDLDLVECFDRSRASCPITPACKLRHVLLEAQRTFLESLDRYTLADLLESPAHTDRLVQLWKKGERRTA